MCWRTSKSCAPRSRCSTRACCAFAARQPSFARAMPRPAWSGHSSAASMARNMQEAHPGKPTLLIVDDDALIVDTLSYALGVDFEIYACESRTHAIELLRQLPQAPQLALVDLGLPPRPHAPDEGFQLIADLLAHSPGMRIFVLSGQNDAAHARHARALGAAEFIAKPCDPAALKKILARALTVRDAEMRAEPDRARDAEELIG